VLEFSGTVPTESFIGSRLGKFKGIKVGKWQGGSSNFIKGSGKLGANRLEKESENTIHVSRMKTQHNI
jgi:hypothetical protein